MIKLIIAVMVSYLIKYTKAIIIIIIINQVGPLNSSELVPIGTPIAGARFPGR